MGSRRLIAHTVLIHGLESDPVFLYPDVVPTLRIKVWESGGMWYLVVLDHPTPTELVAWMLDEVRLILDAA